MTQLMVLGDTVDHVCLKVAFLLKKYTTFHAKSDGSSFRTTLKELKET